ncbi:M50 family metallopeptidase [Actinokineospora inagensis]|uniref:M50 family metallopeptidase n=1 Tax=Actinokineospora inagensis TaxID=103730 RepID=UPI00040CB5C4|nr:M50 family metallopeptidase [Actinokineospora inagensis]
MSVTSGPGTSTGRDASASRPAVVPRRPNSEAPPRRADGVRLIGEMRGSGYRRPPALVRRADGQVLQLTPLLYRVLEAVDGETDHDGIAARVGTAIGRRVTADDIRTLLDAKLRPLGVLKGADGSDPRPRKANPLLGLRLRCVISKPELTRRVTAPFTWLFHPLVVLALVAAFVGVGYWVLFDKGLAGAAYQAFSQPSLLLLVFAVTIVSAGFHEFGHAAAARYGGATPGAMGFGVYLLWPAFYTDVTDSYRLGRAGRLRTDLGGLYFNAIIAVAMFGAWWLSHWDALLLVIATQLLQMVRQLAPMVRFDGYHVLADLTGVPDLFHRIKPTLVGLLPHKWRSPEATVLKPWARAVVTLWVVVVVPMLITSLLLMVLTLPRLVGTAVHSVQQQSLALGVAFDKGDLARAGVRVLAIIAVAVPVLGSLYMMVRMVKRTGAKVGRWSAGKPGRRVVAVVALAAVLAGLAWAWWPDSDRYRPIQPNERGTVQDVLPMGAAAPRGVADRGTAAAPVASTRKLLMPQGSTVPTRDKPVPALVLRPVGADPSTPGWVFPFDRPDPPRPGDNQALAINTTDGSVKYEVSFALVWATGDTVDNRNEAWALASCHTCATVAIAFQVVLIVGQANVIVPENIAVAVNHSCVECLTYALASQLVVTVSHQPSAAALTEITTIWSRMTALATQLRGMTATQIDAALEGVKQDIAAVLQKDAPPSSSAPVTTSTKATSTTTSTPPPSSSATPTTTHNTSSEAPTSEPSTTVPTSEPSPTAPTSP